MSFHFQVSPAGAADPRLRGEDDQLPVQRARGQLALHGRHPGRPLRADPARRPRQPALARPRPLHPEQGARRRRASTRCWPRRASSPRSGSTPTTATTASCAATSATTCRAWSSRPGRSGTACRWPRAWPWRPSATAQAHRVFCLMSDGDCDEGSTWEAILFAAQHRLDNLTVIVDYNKVQALGTVDGRPRPGAVRREARGLRLGGRGRSTGTTSGRSTTALLAAAVRDGQALLAHRAHGQGQGRELHGEHGGLPLRLASPTSSWPGRLQELGVAA